MCNWAVALDPISMVNVTFLNNISESGIGDGLFNSTTNGFSITNGIFWGNGDEQIVGGGTVTYSDVQDGWTGEDNINQGLLLGPLADNDGFTLTHALAEGSPAIDAGDPDHCPNTNQRGFPRPINGNGDGIPICDLGAYEYGSIGECFFLYLPLILRN